MGLRILTVLVGNAAPAPPFSEPQTLLCKPRLSILEIRPEPVERDLASHRAPRLSRVWLLTSARAWPRLDPSLSSVVTA